MDGLAADRFILLTDIAGSSRLAEAYPERYHDALRLHNALTERTVASNGGEIYKHTGDGYISLFTTSQASLSCARELAAGFAKFEPLAKDAPLLVRTALHRGELRPVGAEYFGPALNRASRICQVCHPGQVLLSAAVAMAGEPPKGVLLLDLGIHHLRDLDAPEHLYQLDDTDLPRRLFLPLPTLNNRPNNLLQQPNLFIGRARELAELEQLLSRQRLVTITAPGGYGKSRLAAQLCADLLPWFERGVFFIELAPLSENSRIVDQLAYATGFEFYGSRDPQMQIIDYLREKELLLCFDNFEHVLDGAPLISEIIKAAPRVKILITSREPLRISGEQVYTLEPLHVLCHGNGWTANGVNAPSRPLKLSTETRPSDAALLFADRAALVSPGFKLDALSIPLVEQVSTTLEGVPLSIELAAAWIDSFTLPELLGELAHQLELTARLSDVQQRHRSVRASLDWSWNLLSEGQRRILMALAPFHGGCFADAASAVLEMKGMALRHALAGLADKSWLFSRPIDGQTRFFIRDIASHKYVFEKLTATKGKPAVAGSQETPAGPLALAGDLYEHAVMAHARYFSALIEREGPRLHGHDQLAALSAIKLELLNIYETLDTLLTRLTCCAGTPTDHPSASARTEADYTDGSDLAGLAAMLRPIVRWLGQYLEMTSEFRSMLEHYRALRDAAARVDGLEQLLVWAMVITGWAQQRLSAYDAARTELEYARAMAEALGDQLAVAYSWHGLGNVEFEQGDFNAAHECFARALAVRRASGNLYGIASSLNSEGLVACVQGKYSAAREFQAESLKIKREIGDRYGIAFSLSGLGAVEFAQGNCHAARELFAEALSIRREIGDRRGTATCLHHLGRVESMQGNLSAARELHAEALAIRREIGDRYGVCDSLAVGGCFLIARERPQAAATCLYGAQHHVNLLGFKYEPAERELLEQCLAVIEHPATGLPPAERIRTKAQAEAMPLDDLAEFVQSELGKLQDVSPETGHQANA